MNRISKQMACQAHRPNFILLKIWAGFVGFYAEEIENFFNKSRFLALKRF